MNWPLHNLAYKLVRWLACLIGWALVCGAAFASSQISLDDKMRRFRDGSLRGFALAEYQPGKGEPYSEQDFKDLAATGANIVRVFVNVRKCDGCSAYADPEAEIRYVENVLRQGELNGFGVIVAMLPRPGYKKADFWGRPDLMAQLVSHWRTMANRLKAAPALLAYDLMNEPVVATLLPGVGKEKWHSLAMQMASAIRAEDPNTPLMMEPTPWGLPGSFKGMQPLALPGLVYSFHFYAPHEFTHQGLPGYDGVRNYPDADWDRAKGRTALEEARRFASTTNSPIFVGEFSCVRWAPGNSCIEYARDAIGLFEESGWGWAYHCWRCYHGWDPELPSGAPQRPKEGRLPAYRTTDAPMIDLLRRSFKANQTSSRR